MKIALAQIDPTVGDFTGNLEKIVAATRRASALGARLAVFPELAICGYPPADFLEKPSFLRRCRTAVDELAEATRDLPTAVLAGVALPAGSESGNHSPAGDGSSSESHGAVTTAASQESAGAMGGVYGGLAIYLFGVIGMQGVALMMSEKVNLYDPRQLAIGAIILIVGIGGNIGFPGGFLPFPIAGAFPNGLPAIATGAVIGAGVHAVTPHGKKGHDHNDDDGDDGE